MDIKEEIIPTLSYLGLEKDEALIYLQLLQTGPSTVSVLSKKLQIDRGNVYRALSRLKNLGIASTTFSNPIVCKPVEPKKAVIEIIQRKKDEIVSMEKISKLIVRKLEEIHRSIDSIDDSTFTIIQGRPNVYSWIGRMISQVTEPVYIITTFEDIMMMYHTSIPDKIKSCRKKGGKIRLLTNRNGIAFSTMFKKLGATETKIGQLPSKSRIVVERGKQLMMSPSAGDSNSMADMVNVAFVTNSSEMIKGMYSFCEHLWEKSEPLEKLTKASFKAEKTGKIPYLIAVSHRIKEVVQEEIILEEVNKFIKEQSKVSQIYEKDKRSEPTIFHKVKELEQERIILQEVNKLPGKKFKKEVIKSANYLSL